MKKIFAMFFSALMLFGMASGVFAEDAVQKPGDGYIISEPVALTFYPPDKWLAATHGYPDSTVLKALGYTEKSFLMTKNGQGLQLVAISTNRKDIIHNFQTYGDWSEKVFDLRTANYDTKMMLIDKFLELPYMTDLSITEVVTGDGEFYSTGDADYVVFDISYRENNIYTTGQVYVTVVNGFFLSFLYTSLSNSKTSRELDSIQKLSFKDAIQRISFLNIEGKEILSREQIIIVIGVGVVLIFLWILVSISKARKRRRYL